MSAGKEPETMVFSSLEFLFLYFPLVLLLYFLVPLRLRNAVLFLVSLAFYGWGEPLYVFLMLATITIDYFFGLLVGKYRETNKKRARGYLIAAVIVNLAILAFFKYYNFLVSTVASLSGLKLRTLDLQLPIGISFYTFQALSYVIDVYRLDADAQRNFTAFGTYVTLFPQLIAGPIVRYKDVDDQLRQRTHSVSLFASGIRTFTAGMAKKVLLANAAGEIWARISGASGMTVSGAWLGIVLYTFQIYFDFSGYSDMAIGLGKMLGFTFRENFYYPYTARSVTDFWRRWHISLSTWFREYVYIPLGGNRRGLGRQIGNLLVVWLLTGLWHGASWNFVLWGLYYFLLLLLEKTFLLKLLDRLPKGFGHVYTLLAVVFGWLLFYFEDFGAGLTYLGVMFGRGASAVIDAGAKLDIVSSLGLLVILAVAATPYPKRLFFRLWEKHDSAMRAVSMVLCALGFTLSLAYLVNSSYNPFLYFRF